MKTQKEENKNQKEFDINTFINNNIKIIVPVAMVLIVAIVAAIVFSFSGVTNHEGNTVGNIRNYGYAVSDGRWYYYVSPDDEGVLTEINKIKGNGKDDTVLYSTQYSIVSLNENDNYIYFIEMDTQSLYTTDDSINNKIYRIKKDGSSETPELLNDNDFANECLEIYLINDEIYYIGTDSNIYKMGLDGQDRKLVAKTHTGYIAITEKYILYNAETDVEDNYVTYIMDIDGTNPRPVITDTRLYTVGIDGNYIYYTNLEKNIYRVEIDSKTPEMLYDLSAYNFNLGDDGYAYYFNYADVETADYTVCLYRVKIDGTSETPERLSALQQTSKFLDIVDGKAIYMDKTDEESFIKMIDVEKQTSIDLFQYKLPEEDVVEEVDTTKYVDTDEFLNTDTTNTVEEN